MAHNLISLLREKPSVNLDDIKDFEQLTSAKEKIQKAADLRDKYWLLFPSDSNARYKF